ncbi:MAG: type II secretion system protein [Candidatus Avelusimicrobium sp.]|uniref:type II secretion system protein n=1 Tax=Candidatus Avelusimicrobium sp. TaxID=3048833 RepID=UPI003F011A8B
MNNKKGFTLLELLVAATIIGIMAVFATISYKNSVADARMEAAKSRVAALAGAVQRFRIEHPNPEFNPSNAKMTDVISNTCVNTLPTGLIACGFIGNGGWSDGYVEFFVCNEKKEGNCASSPIDKPLACMTGRSVSKQVARYKNGYIYCVSAMEKGETLGAE